MNRLYYLDASAVVKRYVAEKGSHWVREQLEAQPETIVTISQLSLVEVISALTKRNRMNELILTDLEYAQAKFLQHCQEQYQVIPLDGSIVERAIQLLKVHPLRAYDAIQLSTALKVYAMSLDYELLMTFVCADQTLCQTAEKENLVAKNPLEAELEI